MTISELHKQLKDAYAVDNLNKICLGLLNLYKKKQFTKLQRIAEIISSYVTIEITKTGKGFSKLMMLYHPDRAQFHIGKINKLASENNLNGLEQYQHILQLENLDEIAASIDDYEDIDYSPVYEWDFEAEGFSITHDCDPITNRKKQNGGITFYDAIKIREYGHTNIEYPSYYLHDYEEFELSSCEINDLDGIQFCIHGYIFDISNNRIFDLSLLIPLKQIEELNLSDNKIGYIDALAHLKNLRSVNLANNFVDDLSPLFGLEKLEYLNIEGNKVPKNQIDELTELGVTVDF